MKKCTTKSLQFKKLGRKKVTVNFNGGSITSDAGALLLREIDLKLRLTERIASLMVDNRDPSKIDHSVLSMLRQRAYSIALGYEDLNDHNTLRKDIALQTSVNREVDLASAPTLCRFEKSVTRKVAVGMHKVIVEQFIESHITPPKELILDFDATDDLVHGNQEGKFFHAYYGNHCFLPLYVFCGKQILASYLRTANKDAAKHSWAIFSLLVKRFRQVWTQVKIIFRGDGGFCRHEMLEWCDNNGVFYIVGISRNGRLESAFAEVVDGAKKEYALTNQKQRKFGEFMYAAKTWKRERRIIGKVEYSDKGANQRFIVTNLDGNPQELYDNVYCARGDMENRIKEQKLDLSADRTSCHNWWSNQFRLLLSSIAYILIERIRAYALENTELEKAQVGTIRLKLFKVGAVIIRNTRRILFILSSAYPYQHTFTITYEKLVPT